MVLSVFSDSLLLYYQCTVSAAGDASHHGTIKVRIGCVTHTYFRAITGPRLNSRNCQSMY